MKALIRRIRLPLSFSLRTLLIGVTALCIWLGYELDWIHQRRTFLAQQFEYHLAAAPVPSENDRREWVTEWWHQQTGKSEHAPWGLRLFGETGVANVSVMVPEADVIMRTWGDDDAGLPVEWPEISASQDDYSRAKRLFPEARIRPVRSERWVIEYCGGEKSQWPRPLVIREEASKIVVRLVCNPTVVERVPLTAQLVITSPSDSPVIIAVRTCDGTATTRQRNFTELAGTIFSEPYERPYPYLLKVNIGALTDDQRAAGGATFKLKLDSVIGAVPEVMEKTITILPAKK